MTHERRDYRPLPQLLNNVHQSVLRLDCDSIRQRRRIVPYLREGDAVPHPEYYFFPVDFASCQAIQFLLRPMLLEEGSTQND
jgi:hypothetical protein